MLTSRGEHGLLGVRACCVRCAAWSTASRSEKLVAMTPMKPGRRCARWMCCSAMTRRLMRDRSMLRPATSHLTCRAGCALRAYAQTQTCCTCCNLPQANTDIQAGCRGHGWPMRPGVPESAGYLSRVCAPCLPTAHARRMMKCQTLQQVLAWRGPSHMHAQERRHRHSYYSCRHTCSYGIGRHHAAMASAAARRCLNRTCRRRRPGWAA